MKNFFSKIFAKNDTEEIADLLELFGHSVYSPKIDQALKTLGVAIPDKSKLKRYDSIKSDANGITFTFWYKKFYQRNMREPKSVYKRVDEEEVILHE